MEFGCGAMHHMQGGVGCSANLGAGDQSKGGIRKF